MFPISLADAFENREIRYHWKNSSRHVYTFKNKSLSHYEIDPMSRTEVVLNENHGTSITCC